MKRLISFSGSVLALLLALFLGLPSSANAQRDELIRYGKQLDAERAELVRRRQQQRDDQEPQLQELADKRTPLLVRRNKLAGSRDESTYCPNCDARIIGRLGYMIENIDIDDGACEHCGTRIPGRWD